tara:strand:- start:2608 stop:2784 length:177 start_codon:yes stop_codon:yes gene_type:complete
MKITDAFGKKHDMRWHPSKGWLDKYGQPIVFDLDEVPDYAHELTHAAQSELFNVEEAV